MKLKYRARPPGVYILIFAERRAISKVVGVAIAVLIVAGAGVGALYLSSVHSSTSTSSTPSTVSSSSTTGSSIVSTSSAQSSFVQTLSIDSANWPIDNLNQLYSLSELPWPNWLTYTVYQPLISVNETAEYGTGVIQYLPGLASNWTVSASGTTYTLNLKHGVTFSNGDAFNAYEVWAEEYGFYYLSGNSSTWLESYDLFNMSNVDFGPSTIALMTQSGLNNPSTAVLNIMQNSAWPIYVTNSSQIVFNLQSPFLWFPGTLVVYDGLIYDVNYLLQNGGFGTPAAFNPAFNESPIPGTGPYVVTKVSEDAYVQFAQNPTYWGKDMTPAQIAQQEIFDPGHAANVIVYNKSDDLTRFTDLSTGAVQISEVEASDWSSVTSNSKFQYLQQPPWNGEVALLGLNPNLYPTNITAVRQAIVHAINYTQLSVIAYQGELKPYVGPEYPAWSQFYDLGKFAPYQYNITLAEQILANAGLNTAKFPTFDLDEQAGCQDCINAAQVILQDLSQIGINVDIQIQSTAAYYVPYGTYSTNVANAAEIGQLAFVNSGFGWGPATLTPADYWVTFVSNTSLWGDWPGYSNPTVQACVNAFTSTNNVSKIQQLCTAAQAQIYNDAPYAWLGTFSLWLPYGGSLVWEQGVVKSFLVDPVWTGQSTDPIFNTVTFG
jgi:peptide/nickel transport system substrate-binding protein